MQRRASTRCTSFKCKEVKNDAQGDHCLPQSINPGSDSCLHESLNKFMQADEQPFGLTECDLIEELNPSIPFTSPKSLVYPGYFVHETTFPHGPLLDSDSAPQIGVDWHPTAQSGHAIAMQEHQYLNSTLDGFFEAYQGWKSPDMIDCPQVRDEDMFLTPEEREHVLRSNTWQPLQDYSSGQSKEDPWSHLGHHPSSSPYLDSNNQPHHEGYDSAPRPDDGVATFGPILQHPIVTAWVGNAYDHIADGHSIRPSSSNTKQIIPTKLTPASTHVGCGSRAATLLDLKLKTQSRTARSLPEGTQFNWDSKTGGQLMNARTKRLQSEEERASRQEIRRRGSCDACRRDHRKVTFPGATSSANCTNVKLSVQTLTSKAWL